MPLTVHDFPRMANLYVIFSQTVNHGHIPVDFNIPKNTCTSTILAVQLWLTLTSHSFT
jgi:hypothetical protein